VLEILTDNELMLETKMIKGVDSYWDESDVMLVNDQFLFFLGNPPSAKVREMESDYGFLPSPKYNEAQEYYRHTTSAYNATTLMIPVSCADPNKVAFIQEAMSYESYYTFLPEFYTNFLETKYARDEESVEMLRIIHDAIFYDLSSIAIYNEVPGKVNAVVTNGTGRDSIVSSLTSGIEAAEVKLDSLITTILEK